MEVVFYQQLSFQLRSVSDHFKLESGKLLRNGGYNWPISLQSIDTQNSLDTAYNYWHILTGNNNKVNKIEN